jgi:uncharacterized DUF497 family protein
MNFEWDEAKNEALKRERDICFEDIIIALQTGKLLAIKEHHNKLKYRGQKIYIVEFNNYVYMVPFEESEEKITLKTIIPSRKMTKLYLKSSGESENKKGGRNR